MTVSASRNILLSIAHREGRTFTYHGKGYTYHLHNTVKDIWAKLQITRKVMQNFLKAIGRNEQSTRKIASLDGIEVCEQGSGGWYEIFVIDERKLFAVINFIKKLNKFMNRVAHDQVRKGHYFIEARLFQHTPPRNAQPAAVNRPIPMKPIITQPPMYQPPRRPFASASNVQQLASVINRKYGH